jgi:hypothetical protein
VDFEFRNQQFAGSIPAGGSREVFINRIIYRQIRGGFRVAFFVTMPETMPTPTLAIASRMCVSFGWM